VKQLHEGHIEWTMAAPLWRLTVDPTLDAERKLKKNHKKKNTKGKRMLAVKKNEGI